MRLCDRLQKEVRVPADKIWFKTHSLMVDYGQLCNGACDKEWPIAEKFPKTGINLEFGPF
jgi:hypothetical protein